MDRAGACWRLVGVFMIIESYRHGTTKNPSIRRAARVCWCVAIRSALDSLGIGFALSRGWNSAAPAAHHAIHQHRAIFTSIGLAFGAKIGERYERDAEWAAGVMLILLAIIFSLHGIFRQDDLTRRRLTHADETRLAERSNHDDPAHLVSHRTHRDRRRSCVWRFLRQLSRSKALLLTTRSRYRPRIRTRCPPPSLHHHSRGRRRTSRMRNPTMRWSCQSLKLRSQRDISR